MSRNEEIFADYQLSKIGQEISNSLLNGQMSNVPVFRGDDTTNAWFSKFEGACTRASWNEE